MTPRVRDLLDCVVSQGLKRKRASQKAAGNMRGLSQPIDVVSLMDGAFVDISQSHERPSFCFGSSNLPTLTSSSNLYSFTLDSVVMPSETCLWHGYPRTLQFPDSACQTRRLVGNSMCAPCLGQAIISLIVLLAKTKAVTESADTANPIASSQSPSSLDRELFFS